MPTGYTDVLDKNPEMTTYQWTMEHLVRAFGICVTLRDYPDMTEKEVRAKIANDYSLKYHKRELKNAKKLKTILANRTEEEWKKLWETQEAEKAKDNNESLAASQVEASRHFKVRQELVTVLASTQASEITKNIAKFGIDQLDLVQHETEPYIQEPTTFEAYKNEAITKNNQDIDYHIKELAEAKIRVADRLAAYDRLKKDLCDILVEGANKQ